MVTTGDVRAILTNVTTNLLPESTITMAIRLSETKVNEIKKDSATASAIEDAELMYAAFLAYQFELTRIVRQMGSLPLDARNTLNDMRTTAKEFLDLIASNKKGLPRYGLAEGIKVRWTEYEDIEETEE